MSYLIVSVSHRSERDVVASSRQPRRSLDGRPLRPGTYASQIKEILSEHPVDGRYLPCGYRVMLWPMDQHAPLHEAVPLEFGPFVSRARAASFILEIGTEVKPAEGSSYAPTGRPALS